MTRCLNTHNHNTHTNLPQNILYCKKDGILYYMSRSLNTKTSLRCVGNHHSNRLKCVIAVTIVTGKVSHCFCLHLSFGKYSCLGLFGDIPIITTKNKTRSYLLTLKKMDFLPTSAPKLVSSGRFTWPIT